MRYLTFDGTEHAAYPVVLLARYLSTNDLIDYVRGIESDVVAVGIDVPPKALKVQMMDYLNQVLPAFCKLKTDYLVVTEAPLFKTLTGVTKVTSVSGYIYPCILKDYAHLNIVYVPAPGQIMFNPALLPKMRQSMDAVAAHRAGKYLPPGSAVIKTAHYLSTVDEIAHWLRKLVDVPLAIDIEGFSLKHYDAGIGSIAMAWSQEEGIAFPVDLFQTAADSIQIRAYLKEWFAARKAKTLWHNAGYDVYVLIYQLFMKDLRDNEGVLNGLEIFFRDLEDTQIITYLATNSCAGNKLGLKDQAQEYLGDWAQDVKDIRALDRDTLLTYNLSDAVATWYVYNKHTPRMIQDQQEDVYRSLFLPALVDIIQMQLTGLPVSAAEVQRGKASMQAINDEAVRVFMANPWTQKCIQLLRESWVTKRNSELKVKRVTIDDAEHVTFNLDSPIQLQRLLYEVMELPVLEETASGQPATGGDIIESLLNHTTDESQKELLNALLEYKQVNKILTSFIPAFETAVEYDGHHYLFGSFKLGGTISGRLSSSNPNMQNMPASRSKYAKPIKKMVRAPKGWLFCGLDFASLEDRISALTTKDPNKLKVYTDGYDGHSLRAFAYFGDLMPDIMDTLESINSIQKLYPGLRGESKVPTFALTYQGTWRTLVARMGWSEEKAKAVEKAYHDLYSVSDAWVADRLKDAARVGYVTVAFGLRLRTPMLAQTLAGSKAVPYEAVAEGRSAGNALGQSWGLLNTRAAIEFNRLVRASKYRHDILPCSHIHDAQYYLIRNDAEIVAWVNEHLVRCVQWQDHPEIYHPEVKLGGELSVFYPSWADEMTIPNGAGSQEILQLAKAHKQ